MHCLKIKNKIGTKVGGYNGTQSFRVQFGDVTFYNFLLTIGLMPHKSKILTSIAVPKEYFFDFLRGHFDGDGTFIPIGIRDGNRATCFIRPLCLQASVMSFGYARRYFSELVSKGM
jgi:hypothetical protein